MPEGFGNLGNSVYVNRAGEFKEVHVESWPEYNYLVRVKTSITLPADLLQSIDRINSNRSDFIEMPQEPTSRASKEPGGMQEILKSSTAMRSA
jgi:hypothetical protein